MLVRPGVARHTLPTRHILTSSRLRHPSRCAVASSAAVTATRRVLTTSSDPRLRKKKSFSALVGFERNLATALEERRFGDDVPFEGLPTGLASQFRPPPSHSQPLYTLRPFDVRNPLVLGDFKPAPPKQRINPAGIPGSHDEMLSVFEACVQVGRLDRAALVLKRFEKMNLLEPQKAIVLHNKYLQGRVEQLEAEPQREKGEEVHKWFELHIRAAGLPITPMTIAYMLKASLLTSDGAALATRINRYLSMMPQQAATESLDMGDVLSDEDLATIAQLCPNFYVPAEAPVAEDVVTPAEDGASVVDVVREDEATENAVSASEVLSTPQKGMGLKVLKSTLSMFSRLPDGLDIASLPHSQRVELQAKLERDSVDAAIARWREENQTLRNMGLNTQISTPSLSSKMYDWHQALEARLAEEQAKVEESEAAPRKSKDDLARCLYGPHLLQTTPRRLAAVTILGALSILSMHGADKGVPVSVMVQHLSKIAEEDIRSQIEYKKRPNVKAKARKQRSVRQLVRFTETATGTATSTPGQQAEPATTPDHLQPPDPEYRWPLTIRAKFGAVLLGALLDSAKITVVRAHPETRERVTQNQPAFSHSIQFKRGRKTGVIQANRTLVELMKREPNADALARHLPMLVEPKPWAKFDKGGFIDSPANLIRLKNHEKDQRIYAEAAIERGDMEQMMRGLDVLGKTAWKINRPVFDVMLQAWNTGEEFANIPALDPKVPIPPEPDSTDDPMLRRLWLRAIKLAENEKSGLHSVRCFMNFQLEIARAFRDQTFYFPHNIDFRGRAYPLPTYLNHMGADHVRGLLLFGKGRPLGERGLQWLKVHLANVYGYDKASLKEREDFATQNLDNIFDSADNPLTGKRWWLKAEDPWQCLATCFELKAALSSPDPAAFVSHLPVHQDGTCNGLQHYAALGGDTWGAQQVNLIPGDRPADVYSAVAQLVQESIAKDKAEGNSFAKALDGKITRKVVKQTVMTNVYGVTFIGAKKQVMKQLDALYPNLGEETGVTASIGASYVASKIFLALSNMFSGAHNIQNWLGEIGGRVCRAMTPEQIDRVAEAMGEPLPKSRRTKPTPKLKTEEEFTKLFRNTLVWTTPLRMPVVQPYRRSGSRMIATCLQDLILTETEPDDPVNRRKQLQAFPPNFIHSLDASHMMLSALECNAVGLTFAAVHDSFWTHAADVDRMNTILRDSFIRIHQEDVIGRLKSEFEARYRGAIYRAKIIGNTEAARRILEWRKTRRLSAKEELLMERRRQMLLHSSDPEEVKQGKEMVTPAAIFESIGTPDMVENEVDAEELRATAEEDDMDEDGLVGDETAADDDAEASEPIEDVAEAEALPRKSAGALPSRLPEPDLSGIESFGTKLQELQGTNYFVMELSKKDRMAVTLEEKKTRTNYVGGRVVMLWLPLTFPAIPKKGDFDVKMLKESKYFFS